MANVAVERIQAISIQEIGVKEENIKNNLVMPLLEELGHKGHLDFEKSTHSGNIDIFLKDLPNKCNVVLEIKNADVDLWEHVKQLEGYCRETGALIGVLTNGNTILIFSPFWRGRRFEKQLIFAVQRKELSANWDVLKAILSREALESQSVIEFLEGREEEIEDTETEMEKLEKDYDAKIQTLDQEIKIKEKERNALIEEKRAKINEIKDRLGLVADYEPRKPVTRELLHTAHLSIAKGTQKEVVRNFIMGDGRKKRCVSTDEIWDHVKELPEFAGYRSQVNAHANSTWKAHLIAKEEPVHFKKVSRNQYCYEP